MSGYVLDWCTLLNLYCGWGEVRQLGTFGAPFYVGAVVASEALYAREVDSNGQQVQAKLDIQDLRRQYPLSILSVSSAEQELMVRFARTIDDGEAEGLAIAASRGYAFCSDDAPVRKLALAQDLPIKIVSTPELLQAWAATNVDQAAALPGIVRRITTLARFSPHTSSPHATWWTKQLA